MPSLYLDPSAQQFYLVPDGVQIEDGSLTVVTLPEGTRDVDPESISMWTCGHDEAKDFMLQRATEWGGVAQQWVQDGWQAARKRDWRSVLSAARVDRGLDILGRGLRKAAEDLKQPARPETLLLCSVCYAEVDYHDDSCEACSADLAKDAPVEVSAESFADLERTQCLSCSEEMIASAAVCLSCSTWQ